MGDMDYREIDRMADVLLRCEYDGKFLQPHAVLATLEIFHPTVSIDILCERVVAAMLAVSLG